MTSPSQDAQRVVRARKWFRGAQAGAVPIGDAIKAVEAIERQMGRDNETAAELAERAE